ncbi:tetratricopeptide repeat protein [Flavobacterium hauense]
MKKNLLFFALLVSLACFGQDNSPKSLLENGIEEISKNNYSSAISLLKESASLAREKGDNKVMGKAYTSLGNVYLKSENTAEALKNFLLSLPPLKKTRDNLAIATASKEVGLLYAKQNRDDLAVQYFTEAVKLGKQLNNEMLTADALTGIGPVYEDLHKIDKSLESYSQALAIYRARGMEIQAGQTLSRMGNAYKMLGDYPQSILNYKEALGYFNSANDRFKVADVLCSLGNVLAMMEDYNESLRLYEQAYLDAAAIKYDEVIMNASLGMANAYENLRQYPESVRYHKIHEQKREAFINAKHSKEIAELKAKASKTRVISSKSDEVESAGSGTSGVNYYLYMLIGIGVIIALLIFGFMWRRSLLKKNKEDNMFSEAEGQERLRMVQNLHNDLDSKLEEINSLSESIVERANGMPAIRSQGEAMQETTKKIEENIRDIVWLLTPKTTTLTNYSGSIKEYVMDYFKDSPVEVLVSEPDGISNTVISKESQVGLLSVIKDSLTFVKDDPQVSKVFFGITYTGTRLMISIKDNGQGIEKTEIEKKRLDSYLNSTGGIMRIDSDPGWGSVVKIIIPVEKQPRGRKTVMLNF